MNVRLVDNSVKTAVGILMLIIVTTQYIRLGTACRAQRKALAMLTSIMTGAEVKGVVVVMKMPGVEDGKIVFRCEESNAGDSINGVEVDGAGNSSAVVVVVVAAAMPINAPDIATFERKDVGLIHLTRGLEPLFPVISLSEASVSRPR